VKRLALVGWATNSGVGREYIDAINHLPVSAAYLLPNEAKPTRFDLLKGVPHYVPTDLKSIGDMIRFLDMHNPEVILTWETPGCWEFPAVWRKRGIRWVHVVHWDWFNPEHVSVLQGADLIAPNGMCAQGLRSHGLRSTVLAIPTDTSLFAFRRREQVETFLLPYGFGGPYNRRAVHEILRAWCVVFKLYPKTRLLIRAQKRPEEIGPELPPGVEVKVANTPSPVEAFAVGDVAIMPTRFEGVGLSLVEAGACGLPVITSSAEPMCDLSPGPLARIDRVEYPEFSGKKLESYVVSASSLANRMVEVAAQDIGTLSDRAREWVQSRYSWDSLRDAWAEFLL
jgi:glycosyltransferase involved in cell wall biosynthesis